MISEGFEPTVECPYDNTHIISEKFISKHLLKCRENHKTHKKVACKFDKTHLIPKPELPFHLSVCPSRYLLDRELQLKASAGVDGLHCGDVKGPQIVSNYDSSADEDEWGSEPSSDGPVAYFNKKVSDYEDNKSETPRTIPGANYPSRLPRSAAAVSGEETCRKYPFAPSMVAQIAETSKTSAQPDPNNQVFKFSLSQTYSNPGFGRGRGRGNYMQQDLKPVGALRFQLSDTMASGSADGSGQVNISQPLRTEEYSYDRQQFYDQTSEMNNSYSAPRLANSSSLRHQQNDLQNQQHKETLAQVCRSSAEQLKNNKVDYSPETFTNGEQPMNTAGYPDQTNVPRLPKGRGCLHGIEQLRRPGSSSFVQGSNFNNLPGASRLEGNSADDGSNKPAQQNLIQDRDSNFTDADDAINEAFQRAERKLRKKLRQVTLLEEKSAAGIPLNEEEKSKLEKKEEILSLMDSMSKFL